MPKYNEINPALTQIDSAKWKIVIIDDDAGLNSLIRFELEMNGFTAISILTGNDLMQFLATNNIEDVFFLIDYLIPDMKIEHIVEGIRARNPYAPFMVVTGKGSQSIAVDMMHLGAYDYVIKDLDFQKLLTDKLINAISRYELKRQHDQYERKQLIRVAEAEEKERKRIAEDIHDGLAPMLSTIRIYTDLINQPGFAEQPNREEVIQTLYELIDEAIHFSRNISHMLMPNLLMDFGLARSISSFINKITLSGAVSIMFDENLGKQRFMQSVEFIFYRTITELINNTIKHSQATEVRISLTHEGSTLCLVYEDNGIGFDMHQLLDQPEAASGMGVQNYISRLRTLKANIKFDAEHRSKISISLDLEELKAL